ncbi:ankyrin repeat-containing domain protein [Chlamydoabsidia padenii]|nr:ankyrin repeat-containing domain protein [Chlamydoabsidia padenii]
MSSENLSPSSFCSSSNDESSHNKQQLSTHSSSPHTNNSLQQLPSELLIRIFLLAQNPQLRLVTPALYSISRSALIRAQFLIHRFGRLAALSERGMTSFNLASTLAVVDNCLKLGCSPRADDDYLVWRACRQQDIRLFILMVDAIQPDTRTLDRYLNGAAMQGAVAIVDVLISRYGGSIHHGDDAMMMLACAEHQVAMVQHLITRYGCDPHADRDRYLRRACLEGDLDLVSVLLPGSDIHCFNNAPLQNAAHKQHAGIVKILLEAGADPLANRGASLVSAVRNNDLACLTLLLQGGADPRCQDDLPLLLACRHGFPTILDGLAAFVGTRTTWVNCGKGMPLFEALVASQLNVLERLLAYGADLTTQRAMEGLHEAILRNHMACVQLVVNTASTPLRLLHPPSYYLSKSKVSGPMRRLVQDLD